MRSGVGRHVAGVGDPGGPHLPSPGFGSAGRGRLQRNPGLHGHQLSCSLQTVDGPFCRFFAHRVLARRQRPPKPIITPTMHLLPSSVHVGLMFLTIALASAPSLEGAEGLPWRVTTVGQGLSPSLMYDSSGQPVLFYGRSLARFNGAGWSETILDFPGVENVVHGLVEFAFDPDGQLTLAYGTSLGDGEVVRFARLTGAGWSVANVLVPWSLRDLALAFGPDGQPAIAYSYYTADSGEFSVSPAALGLARFNGATWSVVTVDPDWGGPPSLAFGPDGQPAIAYVGNDTVLRFARFNGNTLSIAIVASEAEYSSLAFGPDG